MCKQSGRYYCARLMKWDMMSKMMCPTNNYKAILQEQLILSRFKNFPNVVNVHRVFVDDESNPYDSDW